MLSRVSLATFILLIGLTPTSAQYHILADAGGQIGPYLQRLAALRHSGQKVIIDGPCLSACTMITGVIPKQRICVTPRARLGFHMAWHPGENGRPVPSIDATQMLMEIYPQNIRRWLARNGGLTPNMKYLTGRELASMYPTCK